MKPLALFTLLMAAVLQAAEPNLRQEPLPPGPLLQRIPDFSSWRVNFFYAQDKIKSADGKSPDYPARDDTFFLPALPRTLVITRTKPRWLVVIKDVKGNSLEQSCDGERQYVSGALGQGNDPVGAFMINKDPFSGDWGKFMDFSLCDFPDLEWVSKQTYKGIQSDNGRDFLVFESNGMSAWIDLTTRYPVLWKKEGERRTFQQLAPPTKMVDLPAQAAALAEAIKKDLARLKRPGPPKMLPAGQ